MESEHTHIWSLYSSVNLILCFRNRDSEQAKKVIEVFDKVYQKHKQKISVSSQSVTMFQDHMLPMLQVEDKASNDLITQIFNFIDTMGADLIPDNIEKFLFLRGILKPETRLKDVKEMESYLFANDSSYLNVKKHNEMEAVCQEMNNELKTTDKLETVSYNPDDDIKYKDKILEVFRQMVDPFGIEIVGEQFNYE